MSGPHVLYRIEGNIAIIMLNRPEIKNAFSPEMITLWRKYLEISSGLYLFATCSFVGNPGSSRGSAGFS
ncbi:MAG: hypothetical protein AB1502_16490 [Thermodesulfobacteriota bacterium]